MLIEIEGLIFFIVGWKIIGLNCWDRKNIYVFVNNFYYIKILLRKICNFEWNCEKCKILYVYIIEDFYY